MSVYRFLLWLLLWFRLDTMDNAVVAMRRSYRNPCETMRTNAINLFLVTIYTDLYAIRHWSSLAMWLLLWPKPWSHWHQSEFDKQKWNCYLCVHGSSRTTPFRSKHKVHESSRTLSFRNCSRNKWRGNTILSWSFRYACELKLSNARLCGGNLNGSDPKLKRHCWNDMHEAAAKNPSLRTENHMELIKMKIFLVRTWSLTLHFQKLVSAHHLQHHPDWISLREHPSLIDSQELIHLATTADHVVTILHCAKSVGGTHRTQSNTDRRRCHSLPTINNTKFEN